MHLDLIRKLSFVILIVSLAACGKSDKPQNPDDSELDAVETKGSEKFNLAKYVGENPKTAALYKAVAPGNAYLFFGEKQKFRLETNLTMDTQGEKGLFMGGPRGIAAAYWLDGYVFGRQIGGQGNHGSLVDVGANGDLETVSAEAYIRFLGDDKYRGKLTGIIEKSFVRDLNFEPVFYPVPMLGVKAGGNVGGELGFRAEPLIQSLDTLNMIFRPRTALSAGLSGGLELLKFASAKIRGVVSLLNVDLGSMANLGFLKAANYSYGHTGIDAGDLAALDGKVEIIAKAEVPGVLPGGIDAALWAKILSRVGIELPDFEWSHTVWNPEPVLVRDIPVYGTSFMRFARMPSGLSDCQNKIALIQARLDQHKESLTKLGASRQGLDAEMTKQSLSYLGEIEQKVKTSCRGF